MGLVWFLFAEGGGEEAYACDGFADRDLADVGLSGGLDILGKETKFDVLDFVEALVVFRIGIDEMFNFGHGEFTTRSKSPKV